MDNITRSHIEQIQAASKQNRLVIFVGAGVSANSGVPLWGSLIDSFKKDLPEHLKEETDYLKIAQHYRDLRGEKEYLDKVKDILKYEKVSPNEIHKEILDLNPCHIVTTNYDDLIEQAALTYNHQYYVVRNDKDLPANKGEKMIIKMHGDFSLGNIVLTENDYFDYSRNFPLIKSYVLSLFATKLVLFVGFSFTDINLKYILRNVQNVLGERMQRAYLLTDKKYDDLLSEYYKSKGLCLVNSLEPDEEALKVGEKNRLQLHRINHNDKFDDDIIEIVISFINEYEDQITYLGKYIRNIFPKDRRPEIRIEAGGISLYGSYKEKFDESVDSESNLADMHNKYGDNWYELIAFLLNNQVYKIDDFDLNTDKKVEEYKKKHLVLAADMYYDLDLVKICNYIKNLRNQSLKYTKEDLQLPFILYKIGNYLEAYKLFKFLSTEFWKKRKYFLYYVSIFNVWSLARILAYPFNNSCVDCDFYRKEYLSIDLQEILNELPIEERLKSILNDLFSFKVVNDLFNEVAKLQYEIAKQRKSAENGGSSLNSNIQKLLHSFRQLFDFCNENCIINDFYTESKDVYKKIGEGVIDSVMTPENPTGFQTKLEKLYEENIFLFVFQLTPDVLSDIFSMHVEKSIPVDDSFCQKLTDLIVNLTKSLDNEDYQILPKETVANYVKNIILLYNNIDATPEIEGIYKLIIDTWTVGRFGFWIEQLNSFYKKLKPSPEHSRILLNKIIETRTRGREIEADYVAKLSKISAAEENLKLKILNEKFFTENINVIYFASFVKAVDEETQKRIIKFVQENAKSLYDLVMAEIYTEEHFLTSDLIIQFREHIGNEKSSFRDSEELACLYLLELCKNKRTDLKDACSELETTCACMKFFQDPLSFSPINDIKNSWLIYCERKDLKELLKNETIKIKAKEYIKNNPWHESFKNNFFDLV